MIRILAIVLLCMPGALHAQTLDFPSNASLTHDAVIPFDSYAFPTGSFSDGAVPNDVREGQVTTQAWRIATSSLTTLQILRPLREQLRNARYRVVFECETQSCGGYDFRFALDVVAPPEMQVSINDYRVLIAERDDDGSAEMMLLLVSRTAQNGYVQITHVGPQTEAAIPVAAAQNSVLTVQPETGIAAQLEQVGRAILSDLTFEPGSAQLASGSFASLEQLADFLQRDPNSRVVFVGHTDADGELAPNIALSERRARSVAERLAVDFAVSRLQITAQGVGFLVPIATNATEAGRTANRRVEVVLLTPAD